MNARGHTLLEIIVVILGISVVTLIVSNLIGPKDGEEKPEIRPKPNYRVEYFEHGGCTYKIFRYNKNYHTLGVVEHHCEDDILK